MLKVDLRFLSTNERQSRNSFLFYIPPICFGNAIWKVIACDVLPVATYFYELFCMSTECCVGYRTFCRLQNVL